MSRELQTILAGFMVLYTAGSLRFLHTYKSYLNPRYAPRKWPDLFDKCYTCLVKTIICVHGSFYSSIYYDLHNTSSRFV